MLFLYTSYNISKLTPTTLVSDFSRVTLIHRYLYIRTSCSMLCISSKALHLQILESFSSLQLKSNLYICQDSKSIGWIFPQPLHFKLCFCLSKSSSRHKLQLHLKCQIVFCSNCRFLVSGTDVI